MSENTLFKPVGIFEGYLMKRKSYTSISLFQEWNKRYFYLNLSKYNLIYWENRRRTGKQTHISLRELIDVQYLNYIFEISKK